MTRKRIGKKSYIESNPGLLTKLSHLTKRNNRLINYLSFKRMILPNLLVIIYILGMIAITLGCVTMFIISINLREPWYYFILWLFILLIGNVIWRVACESLIVVYKIYDVLTEILKVQKQKREQL